MSAPLQSADELLLRSAARRMAFQVSAASTAVVLLTVLGTVVLGPLVHRGRALPRTGGSDDDDQMLYTTLLVVGVLGVLLAGVIGFLVARRAVAPLGQALALQRRFVADASHELRTPLTVLQTRAQLLARGIPAGEPSRTRADELVSDARVLSEIVEELLESARLAQDPRGRAPVDIAALITDVVRTMQILADGAGVDLIIGPVATTTIQGSHAALRRALTALIDNALGHTQRGGSVYLSATLRRGSLQLSVRDDGEGLDSANPAILTQRFARGSRRAEGPGGRRFGLGLALVSEVANAHQGSLRLDRAPVRGTVATLDIPLPAEGTTDGPD